MLCRLIFFIASIASVQAGTISFDLQAESLKDGSGTALSVNGLVLLVADTSQNGFATIFEGSSLALNSSLNAGDDRVLARFDLTTNNIPGFLFENPSITYGSGWDIGDPLALLWFPTLTTASSTADAGTSYGFFSGPPLNGSDPWITPADGSSAYKLYFNTTDGANIPGTHAANLGNASLTVGAIPEPSRALLGMVGLTALGLRRRRR
jgi:MYXO-CTERM domain-containing protein